MLIRNKGKIENFSQFFDTKLENEINDNVAHCSKASRTFRKLFESCTTGIELVSDVLVH